MVIVGKATRKLIYILEKVLKNDGPFQPINELSTRFPRQYLTSLIFCGGVVKVMTCLKNQESID